MKKILVWIEETDLRKMLGLRRWQFVILLLIGSVLLVKCGGKHEEEESGFEEDGGEKEEEDHFGEEGHKGEKGQHKKVTHLFGYNTAYFGYIFENFVIINQKNDI